MDWKIKVQQLPNHGENINEKRQLRGYIEMHLASKFVHKTVMRLFLDKSSKILPYSTVSCSQIWTRDCGKHGFKNPHGTDPLLGIFR